MSNKGILSIACHIPRLRLSREAIASANAWANPGLRARARGHRAICSHDEDSITLAVDAARAALSTDSPAITQVLLASTTLPFSDRQNSTLVSEALGLDESIQCGDMTGSLRAGTTALLNAFKHDDSSLVIAADNRTARPGSAQEMTYGAAAGAIVVGDQHPLARFLGSHSVSVDFSDHYRSIEMAFDYHLEERWIKDEGFLKIIPKTINTLLENYDVKPEKVDHLVIAGPDSRTAATIARECGIAVEGVADDLNSKCGHTGTAHPFLMLCDALEKSSPGQLIVVAGFGQGCDALLFKTTDRISEVSQEKPLQTAVSRGIEDSNYVRYLSFNDLIDMDWGIRSERDNRIAHSAFNRHRKTITGFIGGRCEDCGTAQFPRRSTCVNPECRSSTGQVDEAFGDKPAKVKSFTEDWLAASENPPLIYGNVEFEGGGVVMMDFTGFQPGELSVGMPVSMEFRIKLKDRKRGYRSYFWKAAPPTE